MVLVYFRGWLDWLIDDNEGRPNHVIKAEDRGTYIQNEFYIGYQFYRPRDRVEGVFKLTDSDEKLYKITGVFNPDKISRLSPCSHPDSVFTKMAGNGKLPKDILDKCYCCIAINRYSKWKLRLKRSPHLIEEGKLDYDLVLYESICDDPEPTPSGTAIRKRSPIKNHSEIRAFLEVALDEMEELTQKTPSAKELSDYVLGDDFAHDSIKERDPDDCEAFKNAHIQNRVLKLMDGRKINPKIIKDCYDKTIFKK